MRIIIVICVILIAFLGFQLYGVIDQEIDEAKLSPLNDVSLSDISVKNVDNLLEKLDYTHRITTYAHPSDDLIKASSEINFQGSYASLIYYQDQSLIHEEYGLDAYETIDLGTLKSECVLMTKVMDGFTTNLKTSDYTVYDLGNDYKLIHIQPNNTGRYQLEADEILLKFELIQ